MFFCLVQVSHAVVWHTDMACIPALFPEGNDVLLYLSNDDAFPDTLCLAMLASAAYRGYGVREALLYAGFKKMSLKISGQHHALMGNYSLDAGFSILRERHVRASVQVNYACSLIAGYEMKQGFSCSGAFRIFPDPKWEAYFSSRNLLRLPESIGAAIGEPFICAGCSFRPAAYINTGLSLEKRAGYGRQPRLHISGSFRDLIGATLRFSYPESELELLLQLRIGRWQAVECLRVHPLLGWSHTAGIAYVY